MKSILASSALLLSVLLGAPYAHAADAESYKATLNAIIRDQAIRNMSARFGGSSFRVVPGTDASIEMMRTRIALFLFLIPDAK